MKKRVLVLFSLVPLIGGFLIAYIHTKPLTEGSASFATNAILPADQIIVASNGDIYELTHNAATQITHSQKLIESVKLGNSFAAIQKTTNYSSLLVFNSSGNLIKTLFSGEKGSIDDMNWITDPALNSNQDIVVYVSDRDRSQTNIPDNALYLLNISNGSSTLIVKPDPYSGGIAHPMFDPVDDQIILYDYYQYDPQSLTPYSTIEQYDRTTDETTTLTFQDKNAYQAALSPDGKEMLFLGRNDGANTVTLFHADFDKDNGLSNIQAVAVGDFAYPAFSNTKGYIYFLQALSNTGYNLMSATIKGNSLINIQTVIFGNSLLGHSSYMVSPNKE